MTTPPLNTSAEQDASDAAALKGRRRAVGTKKRSVLAAATPPPADEPLPPLPESHPTMAAALSRRAMTLGHPADKNQPAVAELGGFVPSSTMRDYVVAQFDASEQLVPSGCRTPITRSLWAKGQHVRRDVYQTYLDQHPETMLTVQDVQLPEPEDPEVVGEGEEDGPATGAESDEQDEDEQGGEPATGDDQTV